MSKLLGLSLLVTTACAADGGDGSVPIGVDSSFGVNGRATAPALARAQGITALADGSIAVALSNRADDALLVTTLGPNGENPATVRLEDLAFPTDLAAHGEGFVVSARRDEATAPDPVVVGFTANGNFDPSWGDGGVTLVGADHDVGCVGLDVLADDTVVAAMDMFPRGGIWHLDSAGNIIGELTTFGSNQEDISHVLALPDGKVAALGAPSGEGSIYALSFTPGQRDVTTIYQSGIYHPLDLRRVMDVSLLDEDHLVVLLGREPGHRIDIIGLDGSLRSLYTQGVVAITAIVAADGMVITAGEDGIVRRYSSRDVLDTTFGDQGEIDLSNLVPFIYHLVLDRDGNLLVAGSSDERLAVVRILL
jgi:hypothetical protein